MYDIRGVEYEVVPSEVEEKYTRVEWSIGKKRKVRGIE